MRSSSTWTIAGLSIAGLAVAGFAFGLGRDRDRAADEATPKHNATQNEVQSRTDAQQPAVGNVATQDQWKSASLRPKATSYTTAHSRQIMSGDPEEYVYDDGTTENAFGMPAAAGSDPGDEVWLHHYTRTDDLGVLTGISTAVGSAVGGNITTCYPAGVATVFVGVWDDPNNDGDPSDAGAPLATASAVVASAGDDSLQKIAIGPVDLPDHFFIGAWINVLGTGDNCFPAPADETASDEEAWLIAGVPGAAFDTSDLSAASFETGVDWLLRAHAIDSTTACDGGACDFDETPCNCPSDCGAAPGSELVCSDGIDDDCDGLTDCDDPDCAGAFAEDGNTGCSDGLDNDCDGLIDCADTADCSDDTVCFAPDNDSCDSPQLIVDGDTDFDNTNADTDGATHGNCTEEGSGTDPPQQDIWFDYVATCTGTLFASTCEDYGGSATFDTDIIIYNNGGAACDGIAICPPTDFDSAESANPLCPGGACSDDYTNCDPAGAPCGGGGFWQSRAAAVVAEDDCYRIRVGGWDETYFGPGTLNISCVPAECGNDILETGNGEVCEDGNTANGDGCDENCLLEACVPSGGPANDCCGLASTANDGDNVVVTTGAGTDGPPAPGTNCGASDAEGQVHGDVWMEYTSTCTGELTASTCSDGDFDTRVAIYSNEAADCPLNTSNLDTCNDDVGGCTQGTSVAVTTTTLGQTHLIRVGGAAVGIEGTCNLNIECFPCDPVAAPCAAPLEGAGDDCASTIDCGDGSGTNCYIDETNAGCNADSWDGGGNPVGVPDFTAIAPVLGVELTGCGTTGNYTMPAFTEECTANADCAVGACGNIFPGACDLPQARRDTDWYQFEVFDVGGDGGDQITWTTTSNFSMQALIIDSDGNNWGVGCQDTSNILVGVTAGACRDAVATAFLAPGIYVVHATYNGGISSNADLPCGTPYEWSLLVEEDQFLDCNNNGVRDDVDIANCGGPGPGDPNCCGDCDSDGIPNECQLVLDGQTLQASTTNNITGGSLACPNAFNIAARQYTVSNITIGRVDFAMEAIDGGAGDLPVTVRIWEDLTGFPPDLDLQGDDPAANTLWEAAITISDDLEGQIIGVAVSPPLVITTPRDLIVEYEYDGCDGCGGSWPGSNDEGESAPAWFLSDPCGDQNYENFSEVGDAGRHLVLNLIEELDNDTTPNDCIPDDQDVAFECSGVGPTPCTVTNDCGDDDNDNIRDIICSHWDCVAGFCVDNGRGVPTDMGSQFGGCPSDTFCNIHDRTHALTCFAGTNGCASINIDGSRQFGQCGLDGFCNIHDANAALTCFAGTNSCVCGPAPEGPGGPAVVDESSLVAVANKRSVVAGDTVDVRVFLGDDVNDFQSYQLHLTATGGLSGSLILENVTIEDRKDYVFGGIDGFDEVNVSKGQMLSGIDVDGTSAASNAYLATFTYRVSDDASGAFVVDILSDENNDDQTFLVSKFTDKVEVTGTTPAVIRVDNSKSRRASN
jgi:hypothetical protein